MFVSSFLEHRGYSRHADGLIRCACSAVLGDHMMAMVDAERRWTAHLDSVEEADAERALADMNAQRAEEKKRQPLCSKCKGPKHLGVPCRFAQKFMTMWKVVA